MSSPDFEGPNLPRAATTEEGHGISDQEISNMSDNIILLRFTPDKEMERTIRIIKTRGSAHDNREHTLRISKKGLEVKG